jgi:hypothetical protein
MGLYKRKPVIIEAVQLLWKNWGEVCDLADVGYLEDGRPCGCYLNKDREPIPSPEDNQRFGLLIPSQAGLLVAAEGDWIIKELGVIYYLDDEAFNAQFDPIVPTTKIFDFDPTEEDPRRESLDEDQRP